MSFKNIFLSLVPILVVSLVFPHVSSAATIFSDDFTGADKTPLSIHNNNWVVVYDGHPQILQNMLYTPSDQPESAVTIPISSGDQCVSYTFEHPSAGVRELFLKAKDTPMPFAQNGYYFLIDENNNSLGVGDGLGFVNDAISLNDHLSPGIHTFKACAIGTNLYTYFDDNLVETTHARNSFPDGYPRIKLSPGTSIDNFRYTSSGRQLTALEPAKVYISRVLPVNRFDLKVETFIDSTLVSSGQINSVAPGTGPTLESIPFNTFSPLDVRTGAILKTVISVRNACNGSTLNFGDAIFYYNNTMVDSRLSANVGGLSSTYHFRNAFALSTVSGSLQKIIVQATGAKCSAFKPFGSWTIKL